HHSGKPTDTLMYSKWGATESEVSMALSGDDFVPNPMLVSTRAISIEASADENLALVGTDGAGSRWALQLRTS
ncbi:unnamed protein product, partial [marine sediment metagenome]